MQRNVEIKEEINKIIKAFVHTPWRIYTKRIAKNEIDVIYDNGSKLIKLSASTWQDNYFNELVERACLDINVYYYGEEKGKHLNISSQCSWDGKDDNIYLEKTDEYVFIERVIASFYEINSYYHKKRQLLKESTSISPGSPISKLNLEFYNRDWTI